MISLRDKAGKLLGHSLVIKAVDKKMWQDTLPKMSDQQVQALYDVLVDEVKAWKKEGISILQDTALEMMLLPTPEHGADLGALKARLAGKGAPQPAPNPKPEPQPEEEREDPAARLEEVLPEPAPKLQVPQAGKTAWMLSKDVVVPKVNQQKAAPAARPLPKLRNRVARHGLPELAAIRTVDDLQKIEAAHLRQGPLRDQLAYIKQRITQLASDSDLLAVNIIPVFEQSPLFQTYLKAGSMMIDSNSGDTKLSLDQVMAEMELAGQDTLTQEEFEAVADLRKELENVAGL